MILSVCAVSIPVIANSYPINCVLQDLEDSQGGGGDLWQATYTLDALNWSDPWVRSGAVIEIRFNGALYESIEWVDNDINSIFWHDYWLAGTGPSNSYNQALMFTASNIHMPFEDIGSDFSIQFIWAGVGDPGDNQWWSLYERKLDYIEGRFDALGIVNIDEIKHLETSGVPEPATILLFGVGLTVIAGGRRRVRES